MKKKKRGALFLVAALWVSLQPIDAGQDEQAKGVRTGGTPEGSACFELLGETRLPGELQTASDVRWGSENQLLVTAYLTGVYQIRPHAAPELLVPAGAKSQAVWLPIHLAASTDHVALGGAIYWIGWSSREGRQLEGQYPIEHTVDLDLAGDRLLVLGTQRGDGGQIGPDGAVAWIGSLAQSLKDLRPVFYSQDGPGVESMDACGPMETGVVRWLPDGAFVIVPGVEPDVYLYDSAGRLIRTWPSREIGFDTDCGLSWAEMHRYSANQKLREEWVNQRRIVDDILPLPEGPGLIVRSVEEGVARWDLRILRRDGEIIACEIPVVANGELAFLHGDVRGDQVVFLVIERGFPEAERREAGFVPRLVTARYLR